MNNFSIENYKLEIRTLQRTDTKNALNNGFNTKEEWLNFITKQPHDEIAEAIITTAERFKIPTDKVAKHFDSSDNLIIKRIKLHLKKQFN